MYWKRWNIETNFRHLKYNLNLKEITSKKLLYVRQDIEINRFVSLITEFLTILATRQIDTKKYKINNSVAQNLVIEFIYFLCSKINFEINKPKKKKKNK